MRRPAIVFLALLPWTSPARAASWSEESVHIPTPGLSSSLGNGRRPAGVDALGNVHLVFQNALEADRFEIVYSVRSADGTWSDSQILSDDATNARNPTLATDGAGGVHVVWEEGTIDGKILYRYLPAGGTWTETASIAEAPGLSCDPVVAVDAFDRVHVVWVDSRFGRKELLHVLGAIGGPWQATRILSEGGGGQSNDASIGVDGLGNVHVVWSDRVGSQRDGVFYNLFYIRMEPGRESGAETVRLIQGSSTMTEPYLAVTEDGTVHLVWLDDRTTSTGVSEIHYRRYLPGLGWGKVKQFSRDRAQHSNPVISLGAGGSVNVVWEDYRSGNSEIFYRQITHSTGWDPQGTRLTIDASASESPALIPLPEDRMLVLWMDSFSTNEIRLYSKVGNVLPREP